MIINHNLQANNAIRSMNINTSAASKSMQKLSSGLRINGASDDAAGLAISEKMRGQIRGLDQASSNSQDGISMTQTAEGALNETTSILQRMRELAVQGSNDTNTSTDRSNVQDEMDQLTKEIDRIANTTQFNTKNLLDGSMGSQVATAVANVDTNTSLNVATVTTTTASGLADAVGNSLNITTGSTVTTTYMKGGQLHTSTLTISSASTETLASMITGSDFTLASAAATGTFTATASAAGFDNAIYGLTVTVKDAAGNVNTKATNALSAFTETTSAQDKRAEGSATFQIGANNGQTMNLSINNMGAAALGVSGLKVGTQAESSDAITVIDQATAKVSKERSKLGAVQNRLEHTINNLGVASENLTTAESRIRDVDMAKEMSTYSKNNILSQAAQAMLAQANQQPQQVLQLLR
ncbi:flagellin domain protein [Clostridium sp. DL-VIII]|uniref:flagellin N-terminal helical domain-containing protein n=1 Tax=Clostridium sp. DL-VIII TaxID=641107 RepID=UPI00023B063B|nr:flagellin [Clostridium sp. DL-VIII]EHJ01506.1 flagellin domain protein [Clostridium sp. DL-VIII]